MNRSIPGLRYLLLPLALFQSQGLNSQSTEVSVAIFGNRTISVGMKNGMPIPAEDKFIKIRVAGLGTSPDKNNPTKRAVFWIYGFTQKQGPKITEVKIEEVFVDKADRLVTTDAAPTLKKSEWSAHTDAVLIGESTTPWLYEKNHSVFIFRFTVQFEGGTQSVLYQASAFPTHAKSYLILP